MIRIFLGFLFFLPGIGNAQSSLNNYFKAEPKKQSSSIFTKSNFFLGHSLSQTAYTLPKGSSMVGSFAVGFGVTDNITLGTSPWLLTLYNMPNLVVRTKQSLGTSTALGLHVGYMKTEEYLLNRYKMEAFYSNLILSHVFSSNLRSHFQINAMFFRNDELPFSIRVDGAENPLQISASVVNELSLIKSGNSEFGIGIEGGVIGVNENLPYLHGGLSVYKKIDNAFVQLGVSLSATPNVTIADFRLVGSGGDLPPGEQRAIRTHPEVQIQYYF
jgi:hypothetical protein